MTDAEQGLSMTGSCCRASTSHTRRLVPSTRDHTSDARRQSSALQGEIAGQSAIWAFGRTLWGVASLVSRPTTEGDAMGDTHHDPTDHARTTQPHAGVTMKDNYFWPGFILLALGVIAMIGTVAAAAYRHHEWIAT